MSFKVSYWSGWLLPEMEGISKEVFQLSRYFNSFVFGINQNYWLRFKWSAKMFGINVKFYPFFKLIVPIVERLFDITHIYDDLANWFYLKNLGRRPIIITATTGDQPLPLRYYNKVVKIVVDSQTRYNKLLTYFPPENLKLIYPGIDLLKFRPSPKICSHSFRVLFASAPATPKELKKRGIWQILKAAALLPNVTFTLVWRPWGNTLPIIKNFLSKNKLSNVNLITSFVPNMLAIYQEHHVILAPFVVNGGKPCPTSVLEALACGLPAIVGEGVEISALLEQENAGLKIDSSPHSLVEAIIEVRKNWKNMHQSARNVAKRYFNISFMLQEYSRLYQEILAN